MKAWKIVIVAVLVAAGLPALAALAEWCAAQPRMERPGGRGCTERSVPLASVAESTALAGKGVCKMPPHIAAKCDAIARETEWACSDAGMATSDADRHCRNVAARDARCRRCQDPETGESYVASSDIDVRALNALAQLVGTVLWENEAHAFARVPKCDNGKPPVPMCYDRDCPWADPVAYAACCKLNTRWECPATPPAPTVDDCRRAREKCQSSGCGAAMQGRQLTPCPNDPKCRCEAACESASTLECRNLLIK